MIFLVLLLTGFHLERILMVPSLGSQLQIRGVAVMGGTRGREPVLWLRTAFAGAARLGGGTPGIAATEGQQLARGDRWS